MAKVYDGQTGKTTEVKLASSIESVMWSRLMAAPGGTARLEIFTRYVGNGAALEIKLTDHAGKNHGTFNEKLNANRLTATIQVPPNAKDALYATVKLSRHGLKKKSAPLLLTPPVEIRNLAWNKEDAKRDDSLKLTANLINIPDGTPAMVTVFEHDEGGANEMVTQLSAAVNGSRIEVDWQFRYAGDTIEIPAQHELEGSYKNPEFFFRVSVLGKSEDSDTITFKDYVAIRYADDEGAPIPNANFVLHLPDGTERSGQLDGEGFARIEDVPPGPYFVVFEEPSAESS